VQGSYTERLRTLPQSFHNRKLERTEQRGEIFPGRAGLLILLLQHAIEGADYRVHCLTASNPVRCVYFRPIRRLRRRALFLVVIAAARVALLAAGLMVMFLAAPLLAIFAMDLAAAGIPHRGRQLCQSIDWSHWVVTLDDELTASRTLLRSLVANHDG
jgi:hypothetical protein